MKTDRNLQTSTRRGRFAPRIASVLGALGLIAIAGIARAEPLVPLSGLTPHEVRDASARLVRHYDPQQPLRLAIALEHPNAAAEERLVAEILDRTSSRYRQFLSADEWNRRFAPTAADEQAVVDWAESAGLRVTRRFPNRLIVDVEAPVAAIEAALGVGINSYQVGGRTAFSNDRDPSLPSSVRKRVHSIAGLNSIHVAHHSARQAGHESFPDYAPGPARAAGSATAATPSQRPQPQLTNGYYDPVDVESSQGYDLAALVGIDHCCNPLNAAGYPQKGQINTTIAIVAVDAAAASDLQGFATTYLSGLTFNAYQIHVDGTPTCCGAETTLDMEMAAAWSQASASSGGSSNNSATVIAYEGPNNLLSTFTDIYNEILSDGESRILSTSWVCAEVNCATEPVMDTLHGILGAMVAQGWTLVASSGDQGATSGCGATLAVMYPASDPYMTAVGGTELELDPTTAKFMAETGWTGDTTSGACAENDGGSGGGYSVYFATPSYQSSLGYRMRALPDIALNAYYGENIYYHGMVQSFGGTSVAAPQVAGFFARVNSYLEYIASSSGSASRAPLGAANPLLYAFGEHPGGPPHYPFYDVTSGCNSNDDSIAFSLTVFCAHAGHDLVTGWGSFNALQLAWALTNDLAGDGGPPATRFTGPAAKTWYNTDQTLAFAVSDTAVTGNPVGVAGYSADWDSPITDSTVEATPGSGDAFYTGPAVRGSTSGTLDLAAAGQGCHTAQVRAWDNTGLTSNATFGPVCYDTLPPVTAAALAGTLSGTTYSSAVTVTLTATDSGSGVQGTFYSIDSAAPQAYTAPFTVSTGGAHTVLYHSTDVAGNVEATQTLQFTIAYPQVLVPNVVGDTKAAATTALTAADLVVGTVTSQASASVASGSVISETPAAGTSLDVGSAVNLVISTGPAQVAVPAVTGDTQAAATTALGSAGLVVGTVTTQSSSTVASGNVISETPAAGTTVNVGSAVNLTISSGPAQVAVPNVVGDTQATASTTITAAGLVVGTVTLQSSATVASGNVISETPGAGTNVNVGSAVNLTISSGPAKVAVPNVVGDTQAAASTAITAVGLVVGAVTTQSSSSVPAGSVISESPAAGASVNLGSAVNLVVASGPAQVAVPNVVGDTQAAATTAITAVGLVVGTVTTQSSPTVAAGIVISESPFAGSSVNVGSAVALVVSSGPVVPNVVGDAQSVAATAITGAGLVVGTVTSQVSTTVPQGDVISESPAAGTSAAPGAPVNLVVSSGTVVPNVVGSTQATASTAIAAAGLVTGVVTTQSSKTVPSGSVISESPAAGTSVNVGSAVNLVVSSGTVVPNVVGDTQATATTAITGAGLVVGTVTAQASSTVPSGSVISESPAAGTSVNIGSAVNLVVSSGPAQVAVPNVVGATQAAATTSITGAGLVLGTVTTQASSTVPSGNVISESPAAGTSVNIGSAVNLVVSSGPAQVAVPNVVGDTQGAASAAITSAGLVVGAVTTQASSTLPSGSVISESPAAATSVNVGSAVNLVVSSGPAQVAVPNVVGLTQTAAAAAITGAGLVVGTVTTQSSPTVPAGTVISQTPAAASNVNAGSAVNLVVSTGTVVPNVVGSTQAAATSAITSAGLVIGTVTTQSSSTVPSGSVISESPAAGTAVNGGTAVNLVVSSGAGLVQVPNVVNERQIAATLAITNASLVVGTVTTQPSYQVNAGVVISESPPAGSSVNSGSAVNLVVSSGQPTTFIVPNVIGDTQAVATTAITGSGLVVGTVTTQSSSTVPAGSVISQNPAAGTSTSFGAAVNLVVSSGIAQVTVPSVVGLTQAAATTTITGAGLVLGTVTAQSSPTVPSGSVISQSPAAGTSVNVSSPVNLVVSTGTAVPNVVGLTQAAASTAITGAGLIVGTVTTQSSTTVPAGEVISQSPAAGATASAGSAVNLVLSSGPPPVPVPNVVGDSQAAATAAITAAGLVLGNVSLQSSTTVPSGDVISESPAAGTKVSPGTSVNIIVATGVPPVIVPNVVGDPQAQATTLITAAGLVVGTVTTQSSPTVASGDVISESPVAGTGVMSGSAVNLVVSTGPSTTTVVPAVTGDTQSAATTALTAAGLVPGTITSQSSPTVAAGLVISQSPVAGTSVKLGSPVNLIVSTGPPPVPVPNVTGDTQAAATAAITGAGLVLGSVTLQPSTTVAAGSVVSQSPVAGTAVATGSAVNLVVSSGPPVLVPNVVQDRESAAANALYGVGLTVGTVTTQPSYVYNAGLVISQNPVAGSAVSSGSAVNLVLSSGVPTTFVVPNVVGQPQGTAVTAIVGAGLVVGAITTQTSTTVATGNVISESPAAGTTVSVGAAVNLVVSLGPVAAVVPNVVGATQSAGAAAITAASLVVGTVTTQASTSVPAGDIISESPAAGTSVSAGSAVNLVISAGTAPVAVPAVVGLTQSSAATAIAKAGLVAGTVTLQSSSSVPAGIVISETPPAGTTVATGSAVNLAVSSGPAVPNVVGDTQATAAIAIAQAGLYIGTISTQASSTVASGIVISETPAAGTSVSLGAQVNLVISSGAATVTVPGVVGDTQAVATTAIVAAGLTAGPITTQLSSTVPSGDVISETPAAGAKVVAGSAVSLVISSGPGTVTVPNVVGNTLAAATTVIDGAGLVLGTATSQASTTVPSGSVISQSPPAGASATTGSAVNLIVSSGSGRAAIPSVTGMTQAAATAALARAGFSLGAVTTQVSATVTSGSVISQNPIAGASVATGSAVSLVVSAGPAPAVVPNLAGDTAVTAATAITGAGLSLGTVTTQASASIPSGVVIGVAPAAGSSVPLGSAVNLVVSSGPAPASGSAGPAIAHGHSVPGAHLPAGLALALSQSVVAANSAIRVNSVPASAVQYEVSPATDAAIGPTPSVVGDLVFIPPATRGSYRVTAAVPGTSLTGVATFTVVGNGSNFALYGSLGLAQSRIAAAVQALITALQAHDDAGAVAARADIAAAMAAVNRPGLRMSAPVEPDEGFLPDAGAVATVFPASPDDAAYATVIAAITTQLQAMTVAPGSRDLLPLQRLQAQLAGLAPTPNALVSNRSAINALLAIDLPAAMNAVVAQLTTPVAPAGGGADEVRDLAAAWQLLAGVYDPLMAQLERGMVLISSAGLAQPYANSAAIDAMQSGNDRAVQVFNGGHTVLELHGISTPVRPDRYNVFVINPDEAAAAADVMQDFLPSGVHSINDVWDFFNDLVEVVVDRGEPFELADEVPRDAHELHGIDCLSGSPRCVRLEWLAGWSPVARVPLSTRLQVLVVVQDTDTGAWTAGTFPFRAP